MAYDAFLKISGVEGDGPEGTIELMSFAWGLSNPSRPTTGDGGGGGIVSVSDLSVMKSVDRASPHIIQACATGRHIPGAVLTLSRGSREGKPVPFAFLKLDDVFIIAAQQGGSEGGGDAPTESVSLSFLKWSFDFVADD